MKNGVALRFKYLLFFLVHHVSGIIRFCFFIAAATAVFTSFAIHTFQFIAWVATCLTIHNKYVI